MRNRYISYEQMFRELQTEYDLLQVYDGQINTITIFQKGRRNAASIVATYKGNPDIGYDKQ